MNLLSADYDIRDVNNPIREFYRFSGMDFQPAHLDGKLYSMCVHPIDLNSFPVVFLEHIYDKTQSKSTPELVSVGRSAGYIAVSNNLGKSWDEYPVPWKNSSYPLHCFTTTDGFHIIAMKTTESNEDDLTELIILNPDFSESHRIVSKEKKYPWHGSWSIDQNVLGTIMYAEYASLGKYKNVCVMRSRDNGFTWEKVFILPSNQENADFTIRHFHTCQSDPYITGHWYVSTGDDNCTLFKSEDDGDTWARIFPEKIMFSGEVDINTKEAITNQLFRMTASIITRDSIWFIHDTSAEPSTPGYKSFPCLVRMIKTPPYETNIICKVGCLAVRSLTILNDDLYIASTEDKLDEGKIDFFIGSTQTGNIVYLGGIPIAKKARSIGNGARCSKEAYKNKLFMHMGAGMRKGHTATLCVTVSQINIKQSEPNNSLGGSTYTNRTWKHYDPYVAKFTNNPKIILDMGCGRGLFVEACLEHGIQADGFDINVAYINEANARLSGRANLFTHDIEYPLTNTPSEKYDAVFHNQVIEYLTKSAQHNCIREAYRVLKPGGEFYIGTCSKYDPTQQKDVVPDHINILNMSELCVMLEAIGFVTTNLARNYPLANLTDEQKEIWEREQPEWLSYSCNVLAVKPEYKGAYCPLCGWSGKEFRPYNKRNNAECPNCRALERHRHLWLYYKDIMPPERACTFLMFAPENCIYERLKLFPNLEIYTADLIPGRGEHVFDIQAIPFPDNTFDFVECFFVLCFVENDILGLQEIYRVMKPGGKAFIYLPMGKTQTAQELDTDEQAARATVQNPHMRRLYGADVMDWLALPGFHVQNIDEIVRVNKDTLISHGINTSVNIYILEKGRNTINL
ncbi:MAG: methyltransferase domain-containing protein [Defluviitaleaceae bacterium]|nr:methyltransferase domain-containing protein [Defluviitaleaceae bacterium]